MNEPRLADTIPFPAYPKATLVAAGPYDEELIRNQDDEYNYRIRGFGRPASPGSGPAVPVLLEDIAGETMAAVPTVRVLEGEGSPEAPEADERPAVRTCGIDRRAARRRGSGTHRARSLACPTADRRLVCRCEPARIRRRRARPGSPIVAGPAGCFCRPSLRLRSGVPFRTVPILESLGGSVDSRRWEASTTW